MTEAGTIERWVAQGARVLDLGCGDGTLLKRLWQARQAPGYGVEIDDAKVLECIRNDVNVLQMDLEDGLAAFADRASPALRITDTTCRRSTWAAAPCAPAASSTFSTRRPLRSASSTALRP